MLRVDSGPRQILLDASKPGVPRAAWPYWSDDGQKIYFKSHDSLGRASIWSVSTKGGAPRLLVRFDDPARPSYRNQWALGGNRIYFPVQDRQSDVWIMDMEPR